MKSMVIVISLCEVGLDSRKEGGGGMFPSESLAQAKSVRGWRFQRLVKVTKES